MNTLLKRPELVVAAALVVVVLVAAVVFGNPKKSSSRLSTAPTVAVAGDGLISGTVEACGGASGHDKCRIETPGFCAPKCEYPRYVSISASDRSNASDRRNASNRSLVYARVRDSRFTAAVKPGRYRLDLVPTADAHPTTIFQTKRVKVSAHATKTVVFALSIS